MSNTSLLGDESTTSSSPEIIQQPNIKILLVQMMMTMLILDDSPMQNVSTTQFTSAHETGRGGMRKRGGTCCRGRGRVCTFGGRHNIAPNVSPDWQQNGRRRRRCFNFVGDPGVKVVPDDTTSPLSVFKTFFSDELVQHIVDATNTCAEIIISSAHV